jgi:septation ring formation regulator EzrA
MGLVQKLKSFSTGQHVKAEDKRGEEAYNSEESVIQETLNPTSPSVRLERTITRSEVEKAKEELQVLSVERDAIKSAVEHINAENYQKTKANVNELAEKYKAYLNQLEKKINDRKQLLNLYELEKTQTDIIQLFNTQLEEINQKIESVRTTLDLPLQKQTSIFYYYKS